ncbi:hypothetical protein DCC85_10440 [Paenibacillus sp. CAA11]|uniref:hypothetical protein n=1 Tax=Paenibacillus sp. CAA11 TaxID=1532905 RepID=UPI000D3CEF35|nr:hypothetical protein [Paenibacillus sp. CAA11]AWB44598.1 hypothetical protein DCC85_10440 [Paenibacillus sp. CAA11]
MNKLAVCTLLMLIISMLGVFTLTSPVHAESKTVNVTAHNGQLLNLNENAYYVDSTLPASDTANFQFRTIHEAVKAASSGAEQRPMVIYIEPDVYPMNGTLTDRGLYIDKDWVSLIGLSTDAIDVVLADHRGHTLGAESPTGSGSSPAETLYVTGTGFHAENLTIGNYTNVPLIYPKNPSKNQEKRSSTITQAYAIGASNPNKVLDQYSFKNVRFISMLDTLALGEVQRAYFEYCYVQGTDDFMGGGSIHVMKNTVLHSYTSKPIFAAGTQGMAFIDCTWEIDFEDPQDLTLAKNASTLYLINNTFVDLTGNLKSIHWAPYPSSHIQSYAYNNTLNGKRLSILPNEYGQELSQTQAKAYTAFRLLQGNDGWNPAKEQAVHASAIQNPPLNISMIKSAEVRTGEAGIELTASVFPSTAHADLTWSVSSKDAVLSSMRGNKVTVKGNYTGEKPVSVTVSATAASGISNQTVVKVYPPQLPPPSFIKQPFIQKAKDGKLKLDYTLGLTYEKGVRADESIITWYRVNDKKGTNPVEIAVSRQDQPLTSYTLTSGDEGHYIMAAISPKHLRSKPGEPVKVFSERAVSLDDLPGKEKDKYSISTTFANFPASWQPNIMKGTWTVDTYYPLDQKTKWIPAKESPWKYASGINGAADQQGLLTTGRGARLLYTQEGKFGDMSLKVKLNPEKTAAQGFGSPNGQYLEIYIKYDTNSKTGYALRIERTTKYGFATDFTLYEYVNGVGHPISEAQSTTAFNPECTIELAVTSNVLSAEAVTTSKQTSEQIQANLPNHASISAPIKSNDYGGFGIQHTGTVSEGNRTQIVGLTAHYK